MASKQKLKLRKELDKFHSVAKRWTRQDLTKGAWLHEFLEQLLASHVGGRTPPELEEAFPDAEDEEERAEQIATRAIHAAIAATDAYKENLTGTEVRNLINRKLDGSTKLTGDSVALIAEVLYVIKIYIDLMFDVAGAHGRVFSSGEIGTVIEIVGRALGNFDVDEVKAHDDFFDRVGAKFFERAIINTVSHKSADALRKGFYCYLGKSVAITLGEFVQGFDEYAPPSAETGPMMAGDDAAAFAGGDPLGY